MLSYEEELAAVRDTQAWKFAGLLQERLTRPVGEKVIAVPSDTAKSAVTPESTGGIFTFIAPDGRHIRASCGVERVCETWIDVSQDGGKTWQRKMIFKREDEMLDAMPLESVERPYMYSKMVNGELRLVLGLSVAETKTKCWDIREREAPLANLDGLKDAYIDSALSGNAQYAYKDGVPIQPPDGDNGIYFAATRHHISGHAEEGVNADTVLCRLDEKTRRYEIKDVVLPRAARRGIDKTCNRLTCELVFPDGTRFWGCDVRNVEKPHAAKQNPVKTGELAQWTLGDFDEITSFAVATWPDGALSPKVTSVDAILGRSPHPSHPALRWLVITPLAPSREIFASGGDEAVILLTYERADETGLKKVFQQPITRKTLSDALIGKGPELLVSQDPRREQPAAAKVKVW